MDHFMRQDGFNLRFGQARQQIVSNTQDGGANTATITLETDPGIGVHLQGDRLRLSHPKLLCEPFDDVEKASRVSWFEQYAELGAFLDPKTAQKNSDQREVEIQWPNHYPCHAKPCQSEEEGKLESDQQHQRENGCDGQEVEGKCRCARAANQRKLRRAA